MTVRTAARVPPSVGRADAGRHRTQIRVNVAQCGTPVDLVWKWKCGHRNSVLVRMAGPRAVHQARRLVGLVAFENGERARVAVGIFAAGIKGGHSPDGKRAVLVGDFRQNRAEALKEGHVDRNGVSIGNSQSGSLRLKWIRLAM